MNQEQKGRREFLRTSGIIGLGLALSGRGGLVASPPAESTFSLPPLPYDFAALEPYIDKKTMEIHHGRHHKAYVDNLNKALSGYVTQHLTLLKIIEHISSYSDAVRNNGGGHWNHTFFWKGMRPATTDNTLKNGPLKEAIISRFNSWENFTLQFEEAGKARFGSGWVWLVVREGKLEIGSTANQDNPLMDNVPFKGMPIMGLDVWEHAYYLLYQNRRADYVKAWWNLVNWDEAEKLYLSYR